MYTTVNSRKTHSISISRYRESRERTFKRWKIQFLKNVAIRVIDINCELRHVRLLSKMDTGKYWVTKHRVTASDRKIIFTPRHFQLSTKILASAKRRIQYRVCGGFS